MSMPNARICRAKPICSEVFRPIRVATRIGLNTSLHIGLALQILALGMLTVDPSMLSLVYVMIAQAVSGIAKDLNKMSAKSSIKLLLSDNQQTKLYRWVALLTGSKNSLKGLGFFLGKTPSL